MSNTSDHEKLWELIKDIKFGMLAHRHSDGMLHSHPLTTQNKSIDEGATLYFFISAASEIATRIASDGNVNVSYADPGADSYVSISGTGRIVNDLAKKEHLWSPMNKAWFPGGPTDEDLALLEVRISHAEYWDVADSKMVQLAKMAKAAVTGERPRNLGEHKELNLS
ncbi:MAG: general stress protein [Comamonadaceae bacterium]|nr:MAG: general stress protein [Comamonadaceae bacterium]